MARDLIYSNLIRDIGDGVSGVWNHHLVCMIDWWNMKPTIVVYLETDAQARSSIVSWEGSSEPPRFKKYVITLLRIII